MSKNGGVRPGAGRPKKEPSEKRVKLTASVSPLVMAYLREQARSAGCSLSQVLEKMLDRARAQA